MPLLDVFVPHQRYDGPHVRNHSQVARRPFAMPAKAKKLTEQQLDVLERQVPLHASEATRQAYLRALQGSGEGVLHTDGGELVRIDAQGARQVVAKARPRRKVDVGQTISVRKVQGA